MTIKKAERQAIAKFFNSKIQVWPSQSTSRGPAIYAAGYYHPDDGSDPGDRYGYVGQLDDIRQEMSQAPLGSF